MTVGKQADLVLLEANPLTSIKATETRVGTMIGGHWLAQ